jgi:hypothetical protein
VSDVTRGPCRASWITWGDKAHDRHTPRGDRQRDPRRKREGGRPSRGPGSPAFRIRPQADPLSDAERVLYPGLSRYRRLLLLVRSLARPPRRPFIYWRSRSVVRPKHRARRSVLPSLMGSPSAWYAAAVPASPGLDVTAAPDPAGGQHCRGFWEALCAGQLVDALTGETEQLGDLGQANQIRSH